MSVEEIHSYTYLHRLEHMDDFDPKSLAGELHVNNAYCWKSDPKAVEFMAALEPWFTSIEFNYADLLASTRPMPSYLRDFLRTNFTWTPNFSFFALPMVSTNWFGARRSPSISSAAFSPTGKRDP
ncbi:hypothetical protein L596_026557 [Steinernema carpocapsae]|uniref:Uncharacterized protein n=1 Tax=Steinernema carpocapsae TaxID=34508 RepID=A0A4U5M1P3_STECR|nr:hypothetical protein L596_026557 [Steinernema carpocapsae]